MDIFRFVELGSILEPGRPTKTDKAAILIDAVRMVTQLRGEAQKLKDSNQGLQEKIKELKVILIFEWLFGLGVTYCGSLGGNLFKEVFPVWEMLTTHSTIG